MELELSFTSPSGLCGQASPGRGSGSLMWKPEGSNVHVRFSGVYRGKDADRNAMLFAIVHLLGREWHVRAVEMRDDGDGRGFVRARTPSLDQALAALYRGTDMESLPPVTRINGRPYLVLMT